MLTVFTVMESSSYQNSYYIMVFIICSKSVQILRLIRLFILSHEAVHMLSSLVLSIAWQGCSLNTLNGLSALGYAEEWKFSFSS
jgi:hypothetical protein